MMASCPACRGWGRALGLRLADAVTLYECRACGTQFLERIGSSWPADLQSTYWQARPYSLYDDPQIKMELERRYRDVLDWLGALGHRPASLLDVGCGTGNFLAVAESLGIIAVGVDVDIGAVTQARSRGLRARQCEELDPRLGDCRFDLVTMWDVVEHIYDPTPTLRTAVAGLREGGLLVIETPDARAWIRRSLLALCGPGRLRLRFADHLYYWEHKAYYTAEGLSRLLQDSGCDLVAVRRRTSPRYKMAAYFEQAVRDRNAWTDRLLADAWPAIEMVSRRGGIGNTVLVVGKKRTCRPTRTTDDRQEATARPR